MKVKDDFVTNSSSASFIMSFRATDSETDKDGFTRLFNEYLEHFKDRYPGILRYWDAIDIDSVERKDGVTIFSISQGTSMYNGSEDIPQYMKDLIIESYVNEYTWGFTMEDFEIQEDN